MDGHILHHLTQLIDVVSWCIPLLTDVRTNWCRIPSIHSMSNQVAGTYVWLSFLGKSNVLDWTGEFRPQPVASGMTVSVQWLYSYLWSAKNYGHIWRYNDTSVNFISQTRCHMSCWDGKYWDLPVQLIPYPPSLSMATLENLWKLFNKHGSPLHLCSKQFHKPKKPSVTSWIHLWIISQMLRPVLVFSP